MKKQKGYNRAGKHTEYKVSIATTIACIAVVVVLLIFSATQFFTNYQELQISIRNERMDYVNEISSQIIAGQQFMKIHYREKLMSYAQVLDSCALENMQKVNQFLSDDQEEKILLTDENNQIISPDGNAVAFRDIIDLEELRGREVYQNFVFAEDQEDYWIFVTPLASTRIEGKKYTALIMAIPADSFRNNLAVSLFERQGFAFLCSVQGDIGIRPDNMSTEFIGRNLYSSLLNAGADANEIASLKDNIQREVKGSVIINVRGTEWLINYDYLDAYNEIIVMVPVTVTAAQTYRGLSHTIWYAVMVIVVFCLGIILLVLLFVLREREKEYKLLAAAAKSEFFSKMSHDIRTPLNAIIGMELLAKENIHNCDKATEYLTKSASAADYLLGIINDVLDMSRIESGKMEIVAEPFDLQELLCDIQNIIFAAADEKKIRFSVAIDANLEACYIGDRIRLRQILINLLANAVKFTKEGGFVEFRISGTMNETKNQNFTFIIKDNGIGMSEAYLPNLFTPFVQEHSAFTEQNAGSGLGLAIVHELVTLMGGSISVTSKEGSGSCFTIKLTLPVGNPADLHQEEKFHNQLTFTGKRVLLAEDNSINQEIMLAILEEQFEMKVELAQNGAEAVDIFERSALFGFDVILMDIKMPVMDGLEATRKIRLLKRADAAVIPIIALSANAFQEDILLSLEAGMNAHLSKPVDLNELTVLLEEYFSDDMTDD